MRHLILAVCILVSGSPTAAQRKSIVGTGTGSIYRYLGDTLWVERDTTINRTIFHGDTVTRATFVNDSLRAWMVYVAEGSMARVVSVMGKDGKPAPPPNYNPVSTESLGAELRLIEIELRSQETRARLADLQATLPSGYVGREEPGPRSETVRTYSQAPDLRLVQFKDTVRYIRGCPNAARLDTTTFILFGADSAKRVQPARSFGQVMAVTILGQMRAAVTRESVNSRGPTPPPDLPHPPKVCG